MTMYKLYSKVFNNIVISKLIFQHITEFNKDRLNIRYNYYDYPLTLILKNKNQSMLIEKLNQYNKYINNSNNDNNNYNNSNNNDGIEILKYYIVFKRSSLEYLLQWTELPMDIFKIVYQTFKKEIIKMFDMECYYYRDQLDDSKFIMELESRINNYNFKESKRDKERKTTLFTEKPFYSILIEYGNIDKLMYLISENCIHTKLIGSGSPLHLVKFLQFPKDQRYTNGFMYNTHLEITDQQYKASCFLSNLLFKQLGLQLEQSLFAGLIYKIVKMKKSEIYGQLVIDLFPSTITPVNKHIFVNFMNTILESNDLYMFKLILNKYKHHQPLESSAKSFGKIITLYGYNIRLTTIELIKVVNFDILISSSFSELFITLFENFQEYRLPVNYFIKQVHNQEIAKYLMQDKLGIQFLKQPNNKFTISKLAQYNLLKQDLNPIPLFQQTRIWIDKLIDQGEITCELINKLPSTICEHPNPLLDHLIENGCNYDLISCYINKFPYSFNCKSIKNVFIVGNDGNEETYKVLSIFLEQLKNVLIPNTKNLFPIAELTNLLEFSIDNNCKLIFNLVANKINQHLSSTPRESTGFISNLIKYNANATKYWFEKSPLYSYYLERADEFRNTFKIKEFYENDYSNFIIGEITSTTMSFCINSENCKIFKCNLIKFGILNEVLFNLNNCNSIHYNGKLVNFEPAYKNGNSILNILISMYSNCKQDFTSTIFKLFYHGYLSFGNIEKIVSLAIIFGNQQLIDLLLLRNQFKNCILFPKEINCDEDKNHYLNYIHYLIFKFSHSNSPEIISYLLKQQYKYKPLSFYFRKDKPISNIYIIEKVSSYNLNHFQFLENVGLLSLLFPNKNNNDNNSEIIIGLNQNQKSLNFF